MKKVSLLVASLVTAGTVAMAVDPVYSVNAVGYVKVSVPGTNGAVGKLTMVAVPFVPVGTGTNEDVCTLDQMVGVNGFVPSANASTADQILLWTGTRYSTAFLCDGAWAAEGFPETSNKWCYLANDDVYGGDRPYLCSATNAFNVWAGRGFWIRNRHSNTTLTLAGEVPSIGTNDVDIGVSLTMVAYPYPVDQVLATILTTNDGAHATSSLSTADQILIWKGSGYGTYFLCNDAWASEGFPETAGKWCYMANDDDYGGDRPYAATNVVVKPGDGFWYRSRSGAFSWPAKKPYSF